MAMDVYKALGHWGHLPKQQMNRDADWQSKE